MPADAPLEVRLVSEPEWSACLQQFADTNYRQLAAYSAAAAQRIGARSENVCLVDGGDSVGLCNVRIRQAPLLPIGIAYVNGAPLVLRSGVASNATTVMHHCLRALREEYVCRRHLVLRVVGAARADMPIEEANRAFLAAGFVPSMAKGSYRTFLLDIGGELTEIRQRLDQKWRNVLNKSERQGLEIVAGMETARFDEFDGLYRELVARKNLKVDLGPEFFKDIQPSLPAAERFVVHLARHEGKTVAGHVGAYHGDTAVYLLGAANDVGLKTNASYLLQWRAIEYARRHGCRWYDLGGIDPDANPDVYRFKMRMGGLDVSAPGPFEAGPESKRKLLRLLEALYRMVKR